MEKVPQHVLVEGIMTKLGVETLMACKCVSVEWLNDVKGIEASQRLAYIQAESVSAPTKVILFSSADRSVPAVARRRDGFLEINSNLFGANNLKGWLVMENSCKGLVCFTRRQSTRTDVYLLNPFKEGLAEMAAIGDLIGNAMNDESYGIGFDSGTKEFKIVCFSSLRAKVLTVGSDGWRDIPNYLPDFIVRSKAVFYGGFLYWECHSVLHVDENEPDNKYYEAKILAFDVGGEEFSSVQSPTGNFCYNVLMKLGNDLALLNQSPIDYVDIWTLCVGEWVMRWRLEVGVTIPDYVNIFTAFEGVTSDGNLLVRVVDRYVLYDKDLQTAREIVLPAVGNIISIECGFVESFITVP